jgi:hypothetical protein
MSMPLVYPNRRRAASAAEAAVWRGRSLRSLVSRRADPEVVGKPQQPKPDGTDDNRSDDTDCSTCYRVLVGPGTAFEGKDGLTENQVPDGFETTLAVVEAAEAVPWTKPEELPYAPDRPLPGLGKVHPDRFEAVLLSGRVLLLKKDLDEKLLRQAILRNDGKPLFQQLLNARVPEPRPVTEGL